MDLQLRDKTAIVTGASRGIGRAIAQVLSAEGMRLVVTARSGDLLGELAKGCPGEVVPVALDLREPESARKLVEAAVSEFGSVDLLVNNAGATRRGDFLVLDEGDWQDGFNLKFFGAVRCSREAWPYLKDTKGAIVNIVGVGGRTGSAEFAIGGAVNAALLNLTKVLADRGTSDGVRVNAINPGSIVTDRLRLRIKRFADEQNLTNMEASRHMVVDLGIPRFGEPEEIARAVAFLGSSAAAGFCQGSVLDIDGGQTRTL